MLWDRVKQAKFAKTEPDFYLNSSRPYGSAGAWVKMWSYGNDEKDEDMILSFPWREGLSFSMYYNFGGSSWPSYVGLSQSSRAFTAYIETVLLAPYTGYYTFYLSADDTAQLYGAILSPTISSISNSSSLYQEELLASVSSYVVPYNFFTYSTQVSDSIWLARGQRYSLRTRTVS
jgi:hypothetical protein